MPVYEYKCKVCDEHFDIEQSFTDDTLTVLDGCEVEDSGQHQLKKVFNAVGISFKGDGFYKNDSRSGKKSSTTATKSTDTSSSSTSESSSSSDSASKSDSSSSSSSSDTSSSKKSDSTSASKTTSSSTSSSS